MASGPALGVPDDGHPDLNGTMVVKVSRPPEQLAAGPVLLRRPRPDDAAPLAAAVLASLTHLRPWMPWADDDAARVEVQRDRLADAEMAWNLGTDFLYLVIGPQDAEVVGSFGLHRRRGPGVLEMGYWLHVQHTGLGYATAAAAALTDAALALPDVHTVEIHCDQANRASAAVPQRLGYRLLAVEDAPVEAPSETGRQLIWVSPAR